MLPITIEIFSQLAEPAKSLKIGTQNTMPSCQKCIPPDSFFSDFAGCEGIPIRDNQSLITFAPILKIFVKESPVSPVTVCNLFYYSPQGSKSWKIDFEDNRDGNCV